MLRDCTQAHRAGCNETPRGMVIEPPGLGKDNRLVGKNRQKPGRGSWGLPGAARASYDSGPSPGAGVRGIPPGSCPATDRLGIAAAAVASGRPAHPRSDKGPDPDFPGLERTSMASNIVMNIGEALVGEGNE